MIADTVSYICIFYVNTTPNKEHFLQSALLFGNEAHLWCMKNEAGLRLIELLAALRFMPTQSVLH